MMSNLRHFVATGLVMLLVSVWTYQMLVPNVGVDPALYGVVLVLGLAAGLTLFGKGTVRTALDILNDIQGDES